jgi:divalent metal cation (Fe/Co/Zn/Cd) transporter
MPNETFWDSFAALLKSMPPTLAGVVLIVMAGAVLVYSFMFTWRKATDEARKEKAKASNSVAALSDHKLDAILGTVAATAERVADIHTAIEVLKDRGKR